MKAQFLIWPNSLTNLEIQKYYQNKPKFNGVYSRNNLPKLNDAEYVINLGELKSIGTYWETLNVNGKNIIYFDSYGVGLLEKKLKNS